MSARRRGFTLLEMLVVVGILAALAAAATVTVSQLEDQTRFDDTKTRSAKIKEAIVGAGGLLNGTPNVQGFVADMGRLPANLNELVAIGTQPAYVHNLTFESPVGTTWNAGFGGGWRGPYLTADPDLVATWFPAGTFRDGWGNRKATDALATPDADFGWTLALDAAAWPTLTITSFGLDNKDDGVTPPPSWAETDFKTTILPDEHLLRVQTWSVSVEVSNVSTNPYSRSTAVALYFHATAGATTTTSRKLSLAQSVDVAAGTTKTVTFTFALATDERVPVGLHSVVLVDGVTNDVIGLPTVQQPVPVLFAARATLPQLVRWTVSP